MGHKLSSDQVQFLIAACANSLFQPVLRDGNGASATLMWGSIFLLNLTLLEDGVAQRALSGFAVDQPVVEGCCPRGAGWQHRRPMRHER